MALVNLLLLTLTNQILHQKSLNAQMIMKSTEANVTKISGRFLKGGVIRMQTVMNALPLQHHVVVTVGEPDSEQVCIRCTKNHYHGGKMKKKI